MIGDRAARRPDIEFDPTERLQRNVIRVQANGCARGKFQVDCGAIFEIRLAQLNSMFAGTDLVGVAAGRI
jgi:hypothetical protein